MGGITGITAKWELIANRVVNNDTNIDFTNLGIYQDIAIFFRSVTGTGTGFRQIRLSTDNGATFYSAVGDYVGIDTAGVETGASAITLIGTSSDLARSAQAQLVGTNVNGMPKLVMATPASVRQFVGSTLPVNAIRAMNSAGTLVAGNIYLMGRRFT